MSQVRLLNPLTGLVNKARFVAKSKHAHNPEVYSRAHLMAEIRAARDQSAGLGFFITALMFDTLVSYQHENILADLTDQILKATESGDGEEQKRLLAAYVLQEKRPKFQLKEIGNDTESVIDQSKGVTKDGDVDDRERLANMVRDMWETTVCVPASFTIGGWIGQGRIPESVRQRNPVLVHTPLCKMLERISGGIESLEAAMLDVEWSLCKPIPQELLSLLTSHPLADQFDAFAGQLRQWWYERWQAFRSVPDASEASQPVQDKSDALRAYYRNLEVELEALIFPSSPFNEMREYVALALMARIYNSEYPAAPEPGRHFSDGLLWTRPIGKALLHAFDQAGLSGRVIKVDFHPGSKHYRALTLDVKIDSGIVQAKNTGRIIGTAQSADNGEYLLSGGLITVRSAHKLLKTEDEPEAEQEVSA